MVGSKRRRGIRGAVSAGLVAAQIFFCGDVKPGQAWPKAAEIMQNQDFVSEFPFRDDFYFVTDIDGKLFRAYDVLTPVGAGWLVADSQNNVVVDKDVVYRVAFSANFADFLMEPQFKKELTDRESMYREMLNVPIFGEAFLAVTDLITRYLVGEGGERVFTEEGKGKETISKADIEHAKKEFISGVAIEVADRAAGGAIGSVRSLKSAMYGIIEDAADDINYVRTFRLRGVKIKYTEAKDLSERLIRANTTGFAAAAALNEAYGKNASSMLSQFLTEHVARHITEEFAGKSPADFYRDLKLYGDDNDEFARTLRGYPKALDVFFEKSAEIRKGEERRYGESSVRDEEDAVLSKLWSMPWDIEDEETDGTIPRAILDDIGYQWEKYGPVRVLSKVVAFEPFLIREDLNGDGTQEYIFGAIQGFTGNRSYNIWIYEKTGMGYRQLGEFNGMNVDFAKNKTNGYHDVMEIHATAIPTSLESMAEASIVSYDTRYKFDGSRYVSDSKNVVDTRIVNEIRKAHEVQAGGTVKFSPIQGGIMTCKSGYIDSDFLNSRVIDAGRDGFNENELKGILDFFLSQIGRSGGSVEYVYKLHRRVASGNPNITHFKYEIKTNQPEDRNNATIEIYADKNADGWKLSTVTFDME